MKRISTTTYKVFIVLIKNIYFLKILFQFCVTTISYLNDVARLPGATQGMPIVTTALPDLVSIYFLNN